MRKLDELSPAEQARVLTPGLPAIEVIAIAGDDREFYEAMKATYPDAPWLWNDLPGAPEIERPGNVLRRERFFGRYFAAPDFELSKSTIRGRLFHEAADEWDFDNPGASHD